MPNPLNVPITPPRVAFVDTRTGNVSREWYMFFLSLFSLVSGSNVSLDDVQKAPPVLTVDEINAIVDKAGENLRPSTESVIEQIAQLRKQIEALELQVRPELGTLSAVQQDNVPWLQFDTTPSGFPTGANAHGALYWDDADSTKTLNLVMEDSGGVIQQIGEETYYRIKADAPITNGQVVMFTGTVGASGGLKGAPATGLTAFQNDYIMGVATQNIANNAWGYVTWFGLVRGIDTTGGAEAWVDGQILYYNPAVPGGLTKTVPTAPNPKVIVASVVHAATNGSLFVRPSFGSALGSTDSNVQIGTLTDGDLLIYNTSTNRWENATLTAGSNVTITNGPGSITIASSSPAGTVTGVTASSPLASSGGTTPNISITGSALTKTDDTNVTLTLGGSPSTALLSAASLTLGWNGQLATTRGGTGLSSFTANGLLYANSTSALTTGSGLTYDGTALFCAQQLSSQTRMMSGTKAINASTASNIATSVVTSSLVTAFKVRISGTVLTNTGGDAFCGEYSEWLVVVDYYGGVRHTSAVVKLVTSQAWQQSTYITSTYALTASNSGNTVTFAVTQTPAGAGSSAVTGGQVYYEIIALGLPATLTAL